MNLKHMTKKLSVVTLSGLLVLQTALAGIVPHTRSVRKVSASKPGVSKATKRQASQKVARQAAQSLPADRKVSSLWLSLPVVGAQSLTLAWNLGAGFDPA